MSILSNSARPKHIAMIMDGNGRWATRQKLSRTEGHKEGSNAISRVIESAIIEKIPYISLYAFSTENWKRPITEVRAIFQLLIEFIDTRLDEIHSKGIKICHSGSRKKLSKEVLRKIDFAIEKTAKNKKVTVNFCLNYGGREDICQAAERLIQERMAKGKSLDSSISEKELEKYLYTYPIPPVDLLIRTAGEQRISNFLLWQISYAEIFFTDTLWPDYSGVHLKEALHWFESRKRKFGGLEHA
jgi:undecaprenyl diphosphate synthase